MDIQKLKDQTGLSDAAIGARIGWSQSAINRVRAGNRRQHERLSKALELAFPEHVEKAGA